MNAFKTPKLPFILGKTAYLPAVLLIGACANFTPAPAPMAQLKPASSGSLQACANLGAVFTHLNTNIASASPVAAGALKMGGRDIAEHCLVKGAMFKRKGTDGQDYAIGFEARLPTAWNGRFYYQANGGLDGVVQPALGALGGGPVTGALMQGFAVISSDAGHAQNQLPKFGEELQARLDYGYEAVGKLTPMAKALIASAYGRAPDRSYIGGCSNGGRHAMVAASRYGDQYDGYLIGAPGNRLPSAALAQLWAVPQWAALATPGATAPHPFAPPAAGAKIADLNTALTAAERATVANAVLAKCDALDGAKDGLIQDSTACQAAFNLARDVPTCAASRDGTCLTSAQKQVLAAVHAGGKTSAGQTIYSPFAFDAGIAGANWAAWKFVNSQVLDPGAGSVFMTPARKIDPFLMNPAAVDAGYTAIFAADATFKESADSMMTPPGKENPTNLAALKQRGAKMMLYHGQSDAIFSATDTRAWMGRLAAAVPNSAEFAKYYPVPSMNHCSMGPAADQFDMLTPLVQWVEQGIAPAAITATARGVGNAGGVNAELAQLAATRDWGANRSRPLCAHPLVAQYKGAGSLDEASSFMCR